MRMLASALCVISILTFWMPTHAGAQPLVLKPMDVKNYKVLLQVSRNGGWGATAYKNYLIGLFEGLLSSEGEADGDRHGRLFCLPPERGRGSLTEKFEWLENEMNNVVAKAQPDAYIAHIFVVHLTTSYPCKG
jgi:hypothetical protein